MRPVVSSGNAFVCTVMSLFGAVILSCESSYSGELEGARLTYMSSREPALHTLSRNITLTAFGKLGYGFDHGVRSVSAKCAVSKLMC